ncbi:hypothetical protein KKF61_00615 [Patescibacteria group bacterium]|nr:hypothetical protein [Patescibacteria group bacterium]MBU0963610.1 hypothetical protein [Patescibacteria group bacterium]
MKNIYSLANIKKVKWGILEENKPISLYPIMYPGWEGVVRETGKILGKTQTNAICLHQKDSGLIFIDHKEWTALGQFALKKILKNPNWGSWLNKQILKFSDELVSFTTNKIFKVNLKNKTNHQLYVLYKDYLDKQCRVYNRSLIPVYLDLYKPHLTTYVIEYLDGRVNKFKYSQTAKECFTQLTVPGELSKAMQEELALLKIASQVKKKFKKGAIVRKKLPVSLLRKIEQHIKQHRYIGYNFEGPALPDSYFWQRLGEFVGAQVKPEHRIKSISLEKPRAKRVHKKIVRDIKIDKKHQRIINITQSYIFSKDYRKMALVHSYYEVEPLMREIGRRVNYSLAEVRNCLLREVDLMLQGELKRPADLTKRMKGCLFVILKRHFPPRVFVDHRFTAMRDYLLKNEDLSEVNYFHGQAASLGKARGRVKIINTVRDLPKMKKGDILVSQMTNPDLVPAIKKAAAIVTDLGGVTCHASIVAREFKIPCVIGTKVATRVLKDGDEIEVNANRGEIRKI